MKNNFFTLFRIVFVAGFLFTVKASSLPAQDGVPPVNAASKLLADYVTSWIANDGGIQKTHIPHDMLNMFVRADGVCVTVTNWDEGGTNVAVIQDGQMIAVPEGSGTGGWGRNSRLSAVIDTDYVYQLLVQHGRDGANRNLNANGLSQYPSADRNIEWKTVRRYVWNTGLSAPFNGGYGYKGDMLLVCSEASRDLAGLGMTPTELFVAVTKGDNSLGLSDSIKVYNKNTMSSEPLREFDVQGGLGPLYADDRGGLWMLQGNKIIRLSQKDGTPMGQSVTLPEGVNASSFCVDTKNERILVANYGVDLNILVYKNIYTDLAAGGTFGQTGGIYAKTTAYKQGQTGSLRFMGPRGVGIDANGNIYVANQAVSGGRGASLEAYHESTKEQLWKTEGLIFTATADFDRSTNDVYYTPEKIHKIDYTKLGKRMDEFVAITADPFKYPRDQRCLRNGPFITSAFKRYINNQHFLFVSDMYGGMIAGYRFNEETDGYIGIPFMRIWASNSNVTIWVDKNGDGQETPDEYTTSANPNPYSMSFYPDQKGNIWRGTREQGFSVWKTGENDEHGVPQYGAAIQCALPGGTNGVKRIFYDPEKDELFLVGFSSAFPDRNKDGSGNDTWWCMGSTIAKYKNALSRINQGSNTGNWTADLVVYVPFETEKDGIGVSNAKAFTVEGDYLFVSVAREGYVTLYDRETGEYQGYIKPGAEVGHASGWTDFNYAINARKNDDGS
ncbi:MAG: hypothetical protein FWD31_15155, partial [Planctomycetaceae bacterium]|nr:hypothetical protein [Planctomycetaceae bacterium]